MASNISKIKMHLLNPIVILIIIGILYGCSMGAPAPVSDARHNSVIVPEFHKVNQGETLFSIAWRYGLDYKKLSKINKVDSSYKIFPGQRLALYSVKESAPHAAQNGNKSAKNPIKNSNAIEPKGRSEKPTINSNMSSNTTIVPSSIKWQWPAAGKIIAQFQGEIGKNKGIDLSAKLGESVLAAASGQVVYAGSGLSGYGNLLIIKHNEIFLSAYAHNNDLFVKEGDFVKAGQKIADTGSSGTDRVKLHFEIRSEGKPVDPLKYLPKR